MRRTSTASLVLLREVVIKKPFSGRSNALEAKFSHHHPRTWQGGLWFRGYGIGTLRVHDAVMSLQSEQDDSSAIRRSGTTPSTPYAVRLFAADVVGRARRREQQSHPQKMRKERGDTTRLLTKYTHDTVILTQHPPNITESQRPYSDHTSQIP